MHSMRSFFVWSFISISFILFAQVYAEDGTVPPAEILDKLDATAFIFMRSNSAYWALDKKTGEIKGAWNSRNSRRYLEDVKPLYFLETKDKNYSSSAENDLVTEISNELSGSRIVFKCKNKGLPDILIVKNYILEGNGLVKDTVYVNNGSVKTYLTVRNDVRLCRDYRDEGFYLGAGLVGPLVKAPDLKEKIKMSSRYRATSKGMTLSNDIEKYSFSNYRTKVNDKFVFPWWSCAIANYTEKENCLYYTPSGWEMSLGTIDIVPGGRNSFSEVFTIFPGTWFDFIGKEYPSNPEVKKELDSIPDVPEWVKDIKCYVHYKDMNHLKQIIDATESGYVVVLYTMALSWADYYVEQGLYGFSGGFINGLEIKDWVKKVKALSPRVKVGIYNLSGSASFDARILKKHPEWFRTKNKTGEVQNQFPGMCLNYASMINNPACYDELLSQYSLILKYLDVDYIYLDVPNSTNVINWATGDLVGDEHWNSYWRDMKKLIVKYGHDKMMFYNGRALPYADINFIEARSELRHQFWREFSGFLEETFLMNRPDSRIIPLFWHGDIDRDYINRVLELGWIPSVSYGDFMKKLPLVDAAYEIGNMTIAPADYFPDWKKDASTQLESAVMRRQRGGELLCSFISHAGKPENYKIKLDTASCGIPIGKTIFVWQYDVALPEEFKDCYTEGEKKEIYRNYGWSLNTAVKRKMIFSGTAPASLDLELNADPLRLYQFCILTVPAGIYSDDMMPTNYFFNRNSDLNIEGSYENKSSEISLNAVSDANSAEIILFIPEGKQLSQIECNGKSVTPEWREAGNRVLPVIRIGKGKSTIKAILNEKSTEEYWSECPATVENDLIRIDSKNTDKIVVLKKDAYTVYSGKIRDAILRIPPLREGGRYSLFVADQSKAAVGQDYSFLMKSGRISKNTKPEKAVYVPAQKNIKKTDVAVGGSHIISEAVNLSAWNNASDVQPNLAPFKAEADAAKLELRAGTTRKIADYLGKAFAGFEFDKLDKIKVNISNTFYSATGAQGQDNHSGPYDNKSNAFAGIIIDYHTPKGFTKRVAYNFIENPKCATSGPEYGKNGKPDQIFNLDSVIDRPDTVFSLDLGKHAPAEWDGTVFLSIGTDSVAPARSLNMKILDVNQNVKDGFRNGIDISNIAEEYAKPKIMEIPRAPLAPIIDGHVDDEMWQGAYKTDRFFILGGKGMPKMGMSARLMYDDKYLYIGIKCLETDRENPIAGQAAIWNDDEVEVFIVPEKQRTLFQIITNSTGDNLVHRNKIPYQMDLQVKASVQRGNSWEVEMAIPFEKLGTKMPQKSEQWKINICRFRPPSLKIQQELSTWASLQSNFFEAKNFGTLIFK